MRIAEGVSELVLVSLPAGRRACVICRITFRGVTFANSCLQEPRIHMHFSPRAGSYLSFIRLSDMRLETCRCRQPWPVRASKVLKGALNAK